MSIPACFPPVSAHTSATDDRECEKIPRKDHPDEPPRLLEYGSCPRAELFKKLYNLKIIDGEGRVCKATELPELESHEIKKLKEKVFTPLFGDISVRELLELFSGKFSDIYLYGSSVFYFLFYEVPSYRRRLFEKIEGFPLEDLERLSPLTIPMDIDLAIQLTVQDGCSYFSKKMLEGARDHFLRPVREIRLKKSNPVDRGHIQYLTLAAEGSEVEFSLQGQMAGNYLHSTSTLYLPLYDLFIGHKAPLLPHSFSGQALQAFIDGALGIIRTVTTYSHFIRDISQITRGGSPAMRVALDLDGVRCNKPLDALADEIDHCLLSHHGSDRFEPFAYLFNFCQFWVVDDKKKRDLWINFYRERKYAKPAETWAQSCIDLLIEGHVPFTQISALLHHAFLLSYNAQNRAQVKVEIGHYQFNFPLLQGRVGRTTLQIPYSSKTTLSSDVNLLQLLDQLIPRDDRASAPLSLFEHLGEPPQWAFFVSLLAESPTFRLASILNEAKDKSGRDLDLAAALTLVLITTEKELHTFERPQSVISQGLVYLSTKVEDRALAEWFMELGRKTGMIKHTSREQTFGWLSLLHTQLRHDNAEAIFKRWKELKEREELDPLKAPEKSVELLLRLSELLKDRDELLEELCYLEIPKKYTTSAETFFREQLLLRAGKKRFGELPLTVLKSEENHQEIVRQVIVSGSLEEGTEAFHHYATQYPESKVLYDLFETLLKRALEQNKLHDIGDYLCRTNLPGKSKSTLLRNYLEATFKLRQEKRWGLPALPLNLFLQEEPLPGSETIVRRVLEELPLPKAPYRSLKPQLEAHLPVQLKHLVREGQNHLAFQLICASDCAGIPLKWQPEWTQVLTDAVERDKATLTRVHTTALHHKVESLDLWVALGRSWLQEKSVEKVDECLTELKGNTALVDEACSLYVQQEEYMRAAPLLQRSALPPAGDLRLKRKEEVKKCVEQLIANDSSENKLRGCDLLLFFVDEFLEGEEALWMKLLKALSQLDPQRLLATLNDVIESKRILEAHISLREEGWVLALSSLHGEGFFQWALTPQPFPFTPSEESQERLSIRIVEETLATKDPRRREKAFSYLVPCFLEGKGSDVFDEVKCQLIVALLQSQKSEWHECGMAHLQRLLTNAKQVPNSLPTLIKPLTSHAPKKALFALIPLSNTIRTQKRKECNSRTLLKYWMRCLRELKLTYEQYETFLKLISVAFGESWIKKDRESCKLLQQLIECVLKALSAFPSLREETRRIFNSRWIAKYLSPRLIDQYECQHLSMVSEGILSASLPEQRMVFEALKNQFSQGYNFKKGEERIINNLCDLLIKWSETEELEFFLQQIYSFLGSLGTPPIFMARYRTWITKVCALPYTAKHFGVLIKTVGRALEICKVHSPKDEESYLWLFELYARRQILFRGALSDEEKSKVTMDATLGEVDPKYIKPGSIILYLYYSKVYLRKGNPPFPNDAELFASYIETYVSTIATGLEESHFKTLLSFLSKNESELLCCALKSRNDGFYLLPFQLFIESCFSREEPLGKLSLLNLEMYMALSLLKLNLAVPQANSEIRQQVTQLAPEVRRLKGQLRLMFFELMFKHLLPSDPAQVVSEETLLFLINFNKDTFEHGWLDKNTPQIENNESRLSVYEAHFLLQTRRFSPLSFTRCYCLKYGKSYSLSSKER